MAGEIVDAPLRFPEAGEGVQFVEVVRAMLANQPQSPSSTGTAVDLQLIRRCGDMGVIAALLGRDGASVGLASSLAMEFGRVLAPIPIVPSISPAGIALTSCGAGDPGLEEWVRRVDQGDLIVAGTAASTAFRTTIVGRSTALGLELSGVARRVSWTDHTAPLVVIALTGSESVVCVVPMVADGVALETRVEVDGREWATCVLNGAPVACWAKLSEEALVRAESRSRSVHAGWALGAGFEALTMAVEYAKERRQFGRPIGSFQALQHELVDARVALEGGRELLARTVVAADAGFVSSELAAAAHVACRSAFMRSARTAQQVFGGYGYITESRVHRYYLESLGAASTFGTDRDVSTLIGRHLLDVGTYASAFAGSGAR